MDHAHGHVFICTLLWSLTIPAAKPRLPGLSRPRPGSGSFDERRLGTSLDKSSHVQRSKVRAIARPHLVEGAGRSLPLLQHFLNDLNEDLHQVTFEIIRRIGPAAIPMLTELLRDGRASIRGSAADALIDLAP